MNTKWINKIEQHGMTDMDLVIFDGEKEVARVHKSFKGKIDLKAEEQKEIYAYLNPPPVPVIQKTEVEILKEEIVSLKEQIVAKDILISKQR